MKIIYSTASPALQRWFWWLLLANLVFVVCLKFYLQPLAPDEMVRFEVAKTVSNAEGIILDWKGSGKYEKAIESIYIDYLFIILYTAGMAVACAYLSRLTGHEILIRAGKGASYLLGAAGVCDVVENVAITRSLHGVVQHWNVTLAYDMAAAKFSVVIICLLFILVCIIYYLSKRLFERSW